MSTTRKSTSQRAMAKPAAAPQERPAHWRIVKGVDQQKCAGACAKWKPLDQFARKSAARGGGPIRRCKACIAEEQRIRQSTLDSKEA